MVEVFATPEAGSRFPAVAAAARDGEVAWTLVDERTLASLSGSVQPAGVVAVCRTLHRPLTDLLQLPPRLAVVCAEVRDPGNAGAVVRCADAAGADLVVFAGTSVDPYNAKTVRATAGSLFHVPFAVEPDVPAALGHLRAAGLRVLAADGGGETDLDEALDAGDLAAPTAWLFGNEARGLPAELAALADNRVAIAIRGRAESLNLATAAAVCLFASARAHRAGIEDG